MKRRLGIALTIVAALAGPAAAQDVVLALNPTTMIGYAGTTAGTAYKPRDFGQRLRQRKPPPHAVAGNPAALIAHHAFRPDMAARQRADAHAVATIHAISPPDAVKLRAALANGQIRNAAVSYMRRYGMSPDNVVDTTTLYLASAWYAARASAGDPTQAQMKGLRQQVAATFAVMPAMAGASNAAKQELAESSIIQAVYAGAMANQAAHDPKLAGPVRASITQAVRDAYQIDLAALNLTAEGLR